MAQKDLRLIFWWFHWVHNVKFNRVAYMICMYRMPTNSEGRFQIFGVMCFLLLRYDASVLVIVIFAIIPFVHTLCFHEEDYWSGGHELSWYLWSWPWCRLREDLHFSRAHALAISKVFLVISRFLLYFLFEFWEF